MKILAYLTRTEVEEMFPSSIGEYTTLVRDDDNTFTPSSTDEEILKGVKFFVAFHEERVFIGLCHGPKIVVDQVMYYDADDGWQSLSSK